MNTITTTTLSQKYQVVIPKRVREQMHLNIGSQVMVQPIDSNTAMIIKRPSSLTDALSGLGQDMWQQLGGADEYMKKERASWEKPKR